MNKKGIIFLSIAIVVMAAGIIGYKMWNQSFKDPLRGDAIKVTAVQLFNDFLNDEIAAQKKYVPEKLSDKIVEVWGEIKEIGKNEDGEIYYNLRTNDEIFSVKCVMEKGYEIPNAKVGDTISVRGFCNGYNMDVIVNRCKV